LNEESVASEALLRLALVKRKRNGEIESGSLVSLAGRAAGRHEVLEDDVRVEESLLEREGESRKLSGTVSWRCASEGRSDPQRAERARSPSRTQFCRERRRNTPSSDKKTRHGPSRVRLASRHRAIRSAVDERNSFSTEPAEGGSTRVGAIHGQEGSGGVRLCRPEGGLGRQIDSASPWSRGREDRWRGGKRFTRVARRPCSGTALGTECARLRDNYDAPIRLCEVPGEDARVDDYRRL
jgi:hypothetical protein